MNECVFSVTNMKLHGNYNYAYFCLPTYYQLGLQISVYMLYIHKYTCGYKHMHSEMCKSM